MHRIQSYHVVLNRHDFWPVGVAVVQSKLAEATQRPACHPPSNMGLRAKEGVSLCVNSYSCCSLLDMLDILRSISGFAIIVVGALLL